MAAILETRNLTKFYGRTRGVENLSLRVEEGDFFGFIGPNGAGKSTTIRALLGLIAPTSGEMRVFGAPVQRQKRHFLSEVGYLPSEVSYYPGMRVEEILRYSAKLRGRDCARESEALAERLQLDLHRRAEDLSLGNRKKVGIVLAMQHRPRLYVLDEPTSGLDPLIQREFFALLEERRAAGATVFFSSHVLSEIRRHCQTAAIIREGKIVRQAAVKDLLHSSARRVLLTGVEAPPEIPGVRRVERLPKQVRFLYSGPLPSLFQALGQMPVSDAVISEPDIEEIVLHYYDGGNAQ